MTKYFLFFVLISLTKTTFSSDWDQKADFGGIARHRTTMLAIGNKIYAGLGHYNGAGPNILFEDWWEYDPATNAWTQKANYMGGLMYHASGFTIDNIGYVGTGRNQANNLVNTFYAYNPVNNNWEQKTNFPGIGRRGGVGFAIDGYGYLGTGSNFSDFYKYNPTNDSWTQVSSMPTPGRISAVGFELNGYGYVGTGSSSGAQNDFWQYNPTTDQWTQKANVGPIPRQEASGFGVMGKGYILTGDNYSSGDNYGDMWEYNPIDDTWTQLDDFPGTARRYLSCITLGNVAYAGLGTNGTNFKDFWVYDPVASLFENRLKNTELIAYPNPAVDFTTIKIQGLVLGDFSDLTIRVYDQLGQFINVTPVRSDETTLDLSFLDRGIYTYQLYHKEKVIKEAKIILQ